MIHIYHNSNISHSTKEKVNKACEAQFKDLPDFVDDYLKNTDSTSELIQKFFQNKQYTSMVWCGTGGSFLSAQIISDILGPQSSKKIFFLENLDAYKVETTLSHIDKDKTLFVFASKSGRTADVLILKNLIEKRITKLSEQSLVLTQSSSSPLRTWAEEHNSYIIELPENICGRFSCFTAIGLLALNFYEPNQLKSWKRGAQWALDHKNITAELCEFYLQSLYDEKWISVFWIYSSIFKKWGDWAQQLWAESLAKNTDGAKRVSTPIAALGSLDQHSLLQQFSDGYPDKSYSFFTFNYPKEINKNLQVTGLGVEFAEVLKVQGQSTYAALEGQPKIMLEVDFQDIAALSALFMSYQMVVCVMADLLNVYPFDQPGVEKSKSIARTKLGF
ncbi:MAG: hypothetical protein MK008_04575 [Bdellovibrionales bacterium]|nr:hypothetical protein [Bdellovibrionales bacterium]